MQWAWCGQNRRRPGAERPYRCRAIPHLWRGKSQMYSLTSSPGLRTLHPFEMPIAPNKTLRRRRSVGPAKRVNWVLREVRCSAAPGAEGETLERLVQQEVDSMRALGKSAETIREFRVAAAGHIALCKPEPAAD